MTDHDPVFATLERLLGEERVDNRSGRPAPRVAGGDSRCGLPGSVAQGPEPLGFEVAFDQVAELAEVVLHVGLLNVAGEVLAG